MQRLGYQAVNVGERDVKMGYQHFHERTAGTDLAFVSANIVRQESKEPIFPPHLVVEATSPDGKARRRIGIIGVARFNPLFLKAGPDGSNMVIAHPTERVKAEVEALQKQKVETIVLLAALHKDDARRIIREVPGIDFVIGSYGGAFTINAEQEGDTYILYSGNQGKRFGETRVFMNGENKVHAQVTKMHFLTRIYPSNPEMEKFVEQVPLVAEGTGTTGPPSRYVGSAGCKDCHQAEWEQWSSTAHARSLKSLTAKNKQTDAACVSCHVTGNGQPGGFRDAVSTPELAQVGCESCHGPGEHHAEFPGDAYGEELEIAACTGCHDLQNSPEFDYYAYLPRVSHPARAARK